MPHHRDMKISSYLPLTARIMSRHSGVKIPNDRGLLASYRSHHVPPLRCEDTELLASYGAHHVPPLRREDLQFQQDYLPRTARIMSHIGVKMPSARINTITATIPIRIGSMRAVRLLRS